MKKKWPVRTYFQKGEVATAGFSIRADTSNYDNYTFLIHYFQFNIFIIINCNV